MMAQMQTERDPLLFKYSSTHFGKFADVPALENARPCVVPKTPVDVKAMCETTAEAHVRKLNGDGRRPLVPGAKSAQGAMDKFLISYGSMLQLPPGSRLEFRSMKIVSAAKNRNESTIVLYQQTFKNLPVLGGTLWAEFEKNLSLRQMRNATQYFSSGDVPSPPQNPERAIKVAIIDSQAEELESPLAFASPAWVVLNRKLRPVWYVSFDRPHLQKRFVVDAETSEILLREPPGRWDII